MTVEFCTTRRQGKRKSKASIESDNGLLIIYPALKSSEIPMKTLFTASKSKLLEKAL